jgi:RimJ/RimL family protein N-acetyltransferase
VRARVPTRSSPLPPGLATEGTLEVIHDVFEARAAKQIWAQTMAVNTRSRRVMEQCGLRYVRSFHLSLDDPIAGTEAGEVEYELLREDWPARQQRPKTKRP